jgi:hypothetical protein
MPKFRKKPVVIEAVQWDGTEAGWHRDVIPLSRGTGMEVSFCEGPDDLLELEIETLEGTMTVSSGDWVIRGVKDELYPCKPDIFSATYEPA